MDHNYVYIGCFFDFQQLHSKLDFLSRPRLSRTIENPHVTFQYKPLQVDTGLFGKRLQVKVIGYGNDAENEGLLVQVFSEEPALQQMIRQIPVPHITLSVSETGASVNTARLSFQPVESFLLEGVFGGFTRDKQVDTACR